jgi:trimeric autotransporter adhesin
MLTTESLRCRINVRLSFVVMTLFFVFAWSSGQMAAQRLTLASRTFGSSNDSVGMVDVGPVPVSQPLSLTLRLAPGVARTAALDQLLAAQTTSSSPSYHKWVTPDQFSASYGATDDQITTATSWLQSQGLTVGTVSAAKTRLTVTGAAAQVQQAFAVTLRQYQMAGVVRFANSTQPSLPQEIAPLIAGVSGLDDMPAASSAALARFASVGQTANGAASSEAASLDALGTEVDANVLPILTLNTTTCSSDLAQSDYDAYRDLFRQANAQGITVLASSGCGTSGTGSFPASLAEVTALVTSPTAAAFSGIDPRPSWQSAPGLPDDGNRDEPDLTTSSVAAFAQALTTIVHQNGGRQGNVNAILYSLATTPDLYTQPDGAPAGTWESATGLGVVDLQKLIKVFPRATGTATATTLAYSGSSPIGYGTQVVLTATVTPSAFNVANPTGTITYTSSPQGIIGSSALTNGTATLTLGSLPVGSYTITASYSGDGNYAASTSPTPVSITVTIVNATLAATISPSSNVPYGSTATVTATVVLPNSSGAPGGPVIATIESVTGSVFTATLSPNPGGNTATANIVINAPLPNAKGYTVEVSCQGNTNFQCQSPVDIQPWTTVMGNTLTTVNVSPAAPQAGQPVTLTATINNSGNGTGIYSFSGNVTFYDNGVVLATAPVATNQASISKSLSGNVQHSIVAKYSGDANWNGSSSTPQSVAPTLLPSSLTLIANTYNTLAGVNIVFTATAFTTVANTVGPTGTVTLYDTYNGSVVQLGSPTLTPNGPNQAIAVFSTTGLLAGAHSIYAIYNGDSNFNDATSSTLALNLSDYNLNMVPQTLTLHPGQTGQAVMLLGMVGGFNGTVSFGCTPPSGSEITCSFNPVTLTDGGSTTLSIVTSAPQYATTQQAGLHEGWALTGGAGLAALLCFMVPGRRRSIPTLLLVVFAVCLSANLGCGKGTTASTTDPTTPTTPTDPGTPLGTQIFTITTAGSDGVNTVRHSYQYQLTIQ